MLILGEPSVSSFKKINIIKFFKRYKKLSADFGLSELDAIKRISQYCEIIIEQFIKNLPKYKKGIQKDFKKVLLKKFKKHDSY